MEYQGFKSQALDFNIYSDGENGTSVTSVTTYYTLWEVEEAPTAPEFDNNGEVIIEDGKAK